MVFVAKAVFFCQSFRFSTSEIVIFHIYTISLLVSSFKLMSNEENTVVTLERNYKGVEISNGFAIFFFVWTGQGTANINHFVSFVNITKLNFWDSYFPKNKNRKHLIWLCFMQWTSSLWSFQFPFSLLALWAVDPNAKKVFIRSSCL